MARLVALVLLLCGTPGLVTAQLVTENISISVDSVIGGSGDG